jgi:hypothetical protein
MDCRARGKTVVWGVLLILFVVTGSHGFAADNIGLQWFDKLGEYVYGLSGEGREYTSLVHRYHVILLYMKEYKRAYSIFGLDIDDDTKAEFLGYALYHVYDEDPPDKETLALVFREFRKLDEYEGMWSECMHLIRYAIDGGALELARGLLKEVVAAMGADGSDDKIIELSAWLPEIYWSYKRLGMKTEAEKTEGWIKRFMVIFPVESISEPRKRDEALQCRWIVCHANADVYLRLGDYTNAQIYMDMLEDTILRDPVGMVQYKLDTLIDLYHKMGRPPKGRRLIEALMDRMLPDNESQPHPDAVKFFDNWGDDLLPDYYYESIDQGYWKRKLDLAMKWGDKEVATHVTRVLFGSALFHKDWTYAREVLGQLLHRWNDACACVDCYFYILAGKRIWNDPSFNYETYSHLFENQYYHFDLDYEYAWFMFKRNNHREAKTFLHRAFRRMNRYEGQYFRPQGVYFRSIIDLFWRLDDDEGLLKVKADLLEEYRESEDKPGSELEDIQRFLLDVYLIKERFGQAEKLIKEITDVEMKCEAYIYTAKRYIDIGETKTGENMLTKAFSLIDKKKSYSIENALDVFYRIFFIRPNLSSPAERPVYIDFVHDYNWGPRHESAFDE